MLLDWKAFHPSNQFFVRDDDGNDGDTAQLRAKFKDQIRNLIGRQPRMVKDKKDGWIIAYS